MDTHLADRIAIVTGGGQGIGEGIALKLATEGANVVVVDQHEATAEASASRIRDLGRKALAFPVDVSSWDQVRAMVDRVAGEFGRIDILVNNAGMNIRKMPQEITSQEWDEVLEVNLRSAFLCAKAVYPAMKKAGGGKIISIGSMTSILGGAKLAQYGASKGGILQMTRSIAVAWAPDNIQVNSILPGWINTDLTVGARRDIPGLQERVVARTPAGRWMTGIGLPSGWRGRALWM